ncbi:PREDICTED: E3 ubiquitin-protein ligase SINA-like 4 [Camelina sativa]|uniref:RING-type E3 ubiquitin transferase n=1 Tax=Camelina sativa TaxID=90675 RepID=A0ABM0Y7E8_CAMSA|nr:PREDICTED: E3 ubiquitin-protein ligase SINA-like 4 [Camelina sativa]
MTILSRRNDGGGNSHRSSTKRQRLPSVSTDDSSSGQEEENEKTLVVLSDDSDSDEDMTLQSSKRRIISSPKSVTLPNSNVLFDCPNCFDPLKKPIFQCNNGHLACFLCCIKLKKRCSFCKLPIGDVRCRAMEKVIKAGLVSCSNSMYGCKESTTYGNKLLSHEKVCVFAPCSCPVKDCNYIGSYKDLNSHFRGAHKQSPGEIMSLVLKRSIIFGLDLDDSDNNIVIFQEEKEGDVFVVQGFTASHGVYVTVSHIAPMVPGVRRFSCSVAKLKQYSTLRLGLRVKNIQKSREQEEQPEDDFMLIPSFMLSSDHLKMQISIGIEDAYVHI